MTNERGQYGTRRTRLQGSPREVVGISIYHTVGDRERALNQIGTGFAQLQSEIFSKSSADQYGARTGPLWEWWRYAGIPILNEWQKFQADQWAKYSTRWATNWETYENWEDRLKKLRANVAAKLKEFGTALETVAPTDLPKTLPGTIIEETGEAIKETGRLAKRGAEGAGAAVVDTVKIMKYTAIGVLAIGGVIALTSAVSHLRKGTDPVKSYTNLARGK
jgi:hypothetical protein